MLRALRCVSNISVVDGKSVSSVLARMGRARLGCSRDASGASGRATAAKATTTSAPGTMGTAIEAAVKARTQECIAFVPASVEPAGREGC